MKSKLRKTQDYQDYIDLIKDIKKFSEAPSTNGNPFRHNLSDIIKVEKKVKHAQNNIGSANLISPETGEIISSLEENRVFTKNEHVDHNRFVKIYMDRMRTVFNLSHSAIKVFSYFLYIIQKPINKDKDIIYFSLNDCMEYCRYEAHAMVYRGLTELIINCFIAKADSPPNHYWIDPKTAFNGNRIIILEEYIKQDKDYFAGSKKELGEWE